MVLYISLTLEDLCSAPSQSISAVMKHSALRSECREWQREKKKNRHQQHSMSTWHMDQHISQWGIIGVFWCVVMNSEPLNTSLFDSRWRNVHMQTRRRVELSTGEERCQRWKNKTGESYSDSTLPTGTSYCLQHFSKYPWWQLYTQVNGSIQSRLCVSTAVAGNIYDINSVKSIHTWPFEWSPLCSSYKLMVHL